MFFEFKQRCWPFKNRKSFVGSTDNENDEKLCTTLNENRFMRYIIQNFEQNQ